MKFDSRWYDQFKPGAYTALLLVLLAITAWGSVQYTFTVDLSASQRNSLSQQTERLLATIELPLDITLFASPASESRETIEALFKRYQRLQPKIRFQTLNPDLHPDLARDNDIQFDNEVLLRYQQRSEKLSQISERHVTHSIQRLLRQGERWIVFLEGHGERNPYREANHDYNLFAERIARQGYNIETLNLTQAGDIPANTSVLVLASPRVPLLPGEVLLLREYLDNGGNLLWLADPEQAIDELDLLADELGIEFLPGVVVDPNSQLMGLQRVDFTLVSNYPQHPVTADLNSLSLFPEAQALAFHGNDQWQVQDFLHSDQRSWNENGPIQGEIIWGDNDDEQLGPLTLGLSLTRESVQPDVQPHQQRVAVIGDADFLANQYLGNGSNLDIGIGLINWLSRDDHLIAIAPRAAPDTRLELTPAAQITIALMFLIVLPLLLISTGLGIFMHRRRR